MDAETRLYLATLARNQLEIMRAIVWDPRTDSDRRKALTKRAELTEQLFRSQRAPEVPNSVPGGTR